MKDILVRFARDEFGTSVVDYALLTLLIAIGIIGALAAIATTLGGLYVAISNALTAAV